MPHPSPEVEAFVGIGSNLADPRRQIERAMHALSHLPHTRLIAQSSLYRTAPHGVTALQPDYINAVAMLATGLSPEALLHELQAIERAHRRRRSAPNAPRSLDLDLLLYGAHRRRSARLHVPHPRLHRRAFVLKPLLEIAPDVAIPGLGRARKFLPGARSQRVFLLA
ncbi:MAG TPA: 2-amino-4-hydroxy-6-hydroxymethyldihydropteridine diphosphokinase [Casimicrobiaceae bacterium]|nr:2-amino-4-hydroxy-6-hydroxymethyldihydropteridine diphosphokinase [Casimicrobiaceae bacterium]